MDSRRSVVVQFSADATLLPPSLRSLMDDFRLLTNQCLRYALLTRMTSRGALSRFARTQALEARVTGTIGLAAAEVAGSLASGHRTRVPKGIPCRIPYVRTPFVRVPAASFHFDPESGKLRFSIRRGEWSSITLPVSMYLRGMLADPSHRVTQVHIGLHQAVFVYAKPAPEPYTPRSIVALDTNKSTLDGVRVDPAGAMFVRVLFPEIRAIQARHVGLRRYLGRKKAHDRRVARRLLKQQGYREHHRLRSRLHDLTRSLIDLLAAERSVLVLEDLNGMPSPRRRLRGGGGRFRYRPPSFRRRLSS